MTSHLLSRNLLSQKLGLSEPQIFLYWHDALHDTEVLNNFPSDVVLNVGLCSVLRPGQITWFEEQISSRLAVSK